MSHMPEMDDGSQKKLSRSAITGRLLVTILGMTIVGILLIGLIGLISGWHTGIQFSNGFFILGCLLILFGVLSVFGNSSSRGNFQILYGQSVSEMNAFERTKLWFADMNQGINFLLLLLVPGMLLIGLGILIGKLAG